MEPHALALLVKTAVKAARAGLDRLFGDIDKWAEANRVNLSVREKIRKLRATMDEWEAALTAEVQRVVDESTRGKEDEITEMRECIAALRKEIAGLDGKDRLSWEAQRGAAVALRAAAEHAVEVTQGARRHFSTRASSDSAVELFESEVVAAYAALFKAYQRAKAEGIDVAAAGEAEFDALYRTSRLWVQRHASTWAGPRLKPEDEVNFTSDTDAGIDAFTGKLQAARALVYTATERSVRA